MCARDSGSPTGVTFTSSQVIRGLKSKCALVEVQVSRPVSRLGPSLSLAQILPSGKGLAILPGMSPFPNLYTQSCILGFPGAYRMPPGLFWEHSALVVIPSPNPPFDR